MSIKMIIGITGTLGAGKGSVVEFLKKKGFKHYSAREFIKEEVLKKGLEVNRDTLVYVGNELRKNNSPSYIAEKLYERARNDGGNCVIESLRTIGEVRALREKGDFYFIAVDASQKVRYERVRGRKSETDRISFERFVEDERREMISDDPNKQNLRACIDLADVKIINNGSLDDLEKDVNELLEKIGFEGKTSENLIEIKRTSDSGKRSDYISWDDYFMGIALLSAKRSKDPSTQVGACIVNNENKIMGIGYNGFPIGCSDEKLPWAREGSTLETKYVYVCHAELNAILNSSGRDLKGCKIYVPLFPCNECAKAIIQSGIKEVIYLSDKYSNTDTVKASKIMFNQAGVLFTEHKPKIESINIDFSPEKV